MGCVCRNDGSMNDPLKKGYFAMSWKFRIGGVILSLFLFWAGGSGASSDAQQGPSAFFPVDTYTFDPVPEGTQVVYEFSVQNRGTAPLRVENVRTG